jgi:ADP-ribose pyrophosphatase
MRFVTIRSNTVYHGRAFNVRQDQLCTPDGQVVNLDIVEHIGAVTIVPIDSDDNLLFVRQYRHAVERELLELPAGTLEKDELPLAAAQREMREETGMAAENFKKLGEFFLAPGYSSEYMYIYLATRLYMDPLPGDADEFLQVVKVPLSQVKNLITAGEIQDAKSLAGLYLLELAQLS